MIPKHRLKYQHLSFY